MALLSIWAREAWGRPAGYDVVKGLGTTKGRSLLYLVAGQRGDGVAEHAEAVLDMIPPLALQRVVVGALVRLGQALFLPRRAR